MILYQHEQNGSHAFLLLLRQRAAALSQALHYGDFINPKNINVQPAPISSAKDSGYHVPAFIVFNNVQKLMIIRTDFFIIKLGKRAADKFNFFSAWIKVHFSPLYAFTAFTSRKSGLCLRSRCWSYFPGFAFTISSVG